jgi:hypothetical protein
MNMQVIEHVVLIKTKCALVQPLFLTTETLAAWHALHLFKS